LRTDSMFMNCCPVEHKGLDRLPLAQVFSCNGPSRAFCEKKSE
jgi:hypothetical protein